MRKTSKLFGFPTETVTEGKARFLVPKLDAFVKSASEYAPSKAPVFYNPVMELNRDFAVIALQAYQKKVCREITVCEPLTGCGIRGTRFATEVEGIRKVVMGDISSKAVQIARHNIKQNKLEHKAVVKHSDVNVLLSASGAPHKRFDVIDVDPFGSPVPYLDSAVRALRNHGLIALTATDMAPLCGVHPKACIRKYGGRPLRAEYCHELAIRLLAGCLATVAAKHEMGINPVFSHNAEHYIRLYATVEYGVKNADESLRSMGFVFHCFKCFHREGLHGFSAAGHSGKCSECDAKLVVGGPLWLGKLVDKNFCEFMLDSARKRNFRLSNKIERTLSSAIAQLETIVGYYVVDRLCDVLNLPVPSVARVVDALKKKGFQASPTHFNPKGIKTDASAAKVKETLLEITRR